jgi:hypothetical protein
MAEGTIKRGQLVGSLSFPCLALSPFPLAGNSTVTLAHQASTTLTFAPARHVDTTPSKPTPTQEAQEALNVLEMFSCRKVKPPSR